MAIDFGGEARGLFESASRSLQTEAAPVLEFLSQGFTVTWFKEHGARVWIALLKPHANIADYFTLPLEYVIIGHGFPQDFQQRTLLAEPPADIQFRVDPRVRFVASAAPMMKAACAAWAAQNRLAIVPIDTSKEIGPQGGVNALYDLLSASLWRRDVFDDPEPVVNPAEFFGRELAVQEIASKTYLGQLSAVFGLRKIGKTSLLRRVKDLLDADPSAVNATSLVQCNATSIKAGRWHAVAREVLTAWAESINRLASARGSRVTVRMGKVETVTAAGQTTPSESTVGEAFRRDVDKLLGAASSLARETSASQVRLVAFFDEADELYPQRSDAGYWKDDYFALWNTLQTTKRGLPQPQQMVYVLGGVNPAGVEAGSLLDRPNPLFEHSRLFLKPLDEDESRELMTGLGNRVGLSFDDEALALAFEISGGHPWLLRKLGSQIHQSEGRGARVIVSKSVVEHVFARTRRSFLNHVEWILTHLKDIAPEEHRLLRDIAVGGRDRYLSEWADQEFRETFAEHLAQYGVVRFDGNVPYISIGLIRDAFTQPVSRDFEERKTRLRDAADTLEAIIRSRLVNDITSGRSTDEAIEYIVTSIPSEAKNRPKGRDELRELGQGAGLQALVESLNWGDYVILLSKPESNIVWSGGDLTSEDRITSIRSAVEMLHLARHNNDAELRQAIGVHGFDSVWHDVTAVWGMLSQ